MPLSFLPHDQAQPNEGCRPAAFATAGRRSPLRRSLVACVLGAASALVPAPASAASVHSVFRDGAEASSSGLQSEIDEAVEALEGRISALEKEAEALRQSIQEAQGRWDGKYAEYQRMLANSGGRLNRIGQAKVAKLDAEARAIKAEIEAFESQLAGREREIGRLVAERDRVVSRRRPAESPESRDGGATRVPPMERSASAIAGGRDDDDAGAAPRGSQGTPVPSPPEPDPAQCILGEWVPSFDPLDPVGAMRPGVLVFRVSEFQERFGQRELVLQAEHEFLSVGHGEKAMQSSHSVASPDSDGRIRHHYRMARPDARGMLVRSVWHRGPSVAIGAAMPRLEPWIDEELLLRRWEEEEDRLEVFRLSGERVGRMTLRCETSDGHRRPVMLSTKGSGVVKHIWNESTSIDGGDTSIQHWTYGADGRVAAFSTRLDLGPLDRLEELAEQQGYSSDEQEILMRGWELGRRCVNRFEYSYDERGRMKRIVSETIHYQVSPSEKVLVERPGFLPYELEGYSFVIDGQAVSLSDIQISNSVIRERGGSSLFTIDPAIEVENTPLDGWTISRFGRDVRRVRRFVYEMERWDEDGRWLACRLLRDDEAGSQEIGALEREFADRDPDAPAVDGSFMLLGGDIGPIADQVAVIGRGFPGRGSADPMTLGIEEPPVSPGGVSRWWFLVAAPLALPVVAVVVARSRRGD
jgi:hypothetical protein